MRFIVIVLMLNVLLPDMTSAQGYWEELDGPPNSELIYGAYELIPRGADSVFVLLQGGVALSTNEGRSWERRSKGLTPMSLRSMAVDSAGMLIAISTMDGVFRSTDAGMSWVQSNEGIVKPEGAHYNFELSDICYNHFNDTWYIASVNSTVLFSSDRGNSWSSATLDTLQRRFQSILAAENGNIIVCDHTGVNTWFREQDRWMMTALSGEYLHRAASRIFMTNQTGYLISDDDGETWLEIPELDGLVNKRIFDMGEFGWYMSGEDALMYTWVLHSTNSGGSWTRLDTLWNYANAVYSMAAMPSGRILIGEDQSILLSDTGRSYWVPTIEGAGRLQCLDAAITKDGDVLVNTRSVDGIFVYRNHTSQWQNLAAGFSGTDLHVHSSGTILLRSGSGIRRSTDNGISWESQVLDYGYAFIAEGSDGTLYTGGLVNGTLYSSTDAGATWTAGTVKLLASKVIDAAVSPEGDVFLLSEKQGVLCVNGALTQIKDSLPLSATGELYSISINEDGSILVSADRGLFHSPGAPATWTSWALPDTSLSLPATRRLAPWMMDTDGKGNTFCLFRILDNPRSYSQYWVTELHETTDHGASWTELELPQPFQIYSMFRILDDGKMYLASTSEGLFRSRSSVLSVDAPAPVAASAGNELQCWPQPARHELTVAWDGSEAVHTLLVHDCMGREIDRVKLNMDASLRKRYAYNAARVRPGLYFLTVLGAHTAFRTRVVVSAGL